VAALYDLLVIGGGINGTGIARDAAGRGLSVLLAEQDDLGGATSSASTKLIHGGLRYLETFQFRLVREALKERTLLLRVAPHLVSPLRFVLPHEPHLRPAWLLRLGLFLYDRLGGRGPLPPSRPIDLAQDAAGAPLRPGLARGFAYADCWVDDARLVVMNAISAREKGATILTRCRFESAVRDGALWRAVLQDANGERRVDARALVLAAGPSIRRVQGHVSIARPAGRVRLVKGSHIVVARLFAHDSAYIFQNRDGRVVFAIPYERDFTLIGTTDEPVADERAPAISTTETDYLCAAASAYFRQPVSAADVVWTYAGVRPLWDDGSKDAKSVTRDYVLELDAEGGAPCLSIYGGKITTYRRLALAALDRLKRFLPQMGAEWTQDEPLPGGDAGPFDDFVKRMQQRHDGLDPGWIAAAARRHGTRLHRLLEAGPPGRDFGGGLFEGEARWMRREEWARTAEDILWRRTKSGLHMTAAQREAFAAWMAEG
jgi:glycerol-3-phosphate dehydrogenase